MHGQTDRFAPDGPLFLRGAGMLGCLVVFTVDGYLKLYLEAGAPVAIEVLLPPGIESRPEENCAGGTSQNGKMTGRFCQIHGDQAELNGVLGTRPFTISATAKRTRELLKAS